MHEQRFSAAALARFLKVMGDMLSLLGAEKS
jgi:hypothetical protein